MKISSISYGTNYMNVAASRPQFEGRGSNTTPAEQIVASGRAAVVEAGKGAKIDLKA